MDPTYAEGYRGKARAIREMADRMLIITCGVFPLGFSGYLDNKPEVKSVWYGDMELGVCRRQVMPEPDLEFAAEVVWLYAQVEKDYREALRLDPTDATCWVELSYVLQHLGKSNEAANNLNKALAILNKAIQADGTDERSYSERAEILEELGKIELAISDLERMLTLSTREFELDSTRRKIEELRRRKEGAREK
jgi:tetratricopeptide (TPR) repeat protein